jgi:hypothetical protein
MLPNFVVIGAMKAGTTSLYRYLRAHPQAFMPEAKGLNIVADRHWGRGLGRYEAQFAGAGGPVAVRVPGSRALRRASRRPSPPPASRARRLGYRLGDG